MSKNYGKVKKQKKTKKSGIPFKCSVVPDRTDYRDRPYMPPVHDAPLLKLEPPRGLPVLNQGDTSACTGFSLATVIHHLLLRAERPEASAVSPFMLYSMARRYDEFPGDPDEDSGSSLRGAMKGWFKHGVCRANLWPKEKMPKATTDPSEDWWLDAVKRPLGAYYRVDHRSITDMHVALNDIGVLYASALCHDGWDQDNLVAASNGGYAKVKPRKAARDDGGHAFAIVGYNVDGFIVHNSWDTDWGTKGQAVLTYEDWLENAMDCWVAQLGVVTDQHNEIAKAPSLRVKNQKVELAGDRSLRNHELAPFIVDMENNGKLSTSGDFRTNEADLDLLVNEHIQHARDTWKLADSAPVDIAIYAHGGLTSESSAADTAAQWIPALYQNHIFPIFLMWETGLFATLKNRLSDIVHDQPVPTAGFVDSIKNFWNRRLEKLLSVPGTAIWGEMKQNAEAITSNASSGGRKLYQATTKSPFFKDKTKVRLHLIGHSAGAIVHSHAAQVLSQFGWRFESVHFMAPAVTVKTFDETMQPLIKSGKVGSYHQFHLTDVVEQVDPTCKPILLYSRSLLYLVSQSFEKGIETPILGMEKYFDKYQKAKLPNVSKWRAPGSDTASTTHGGFDNDDVTMNKIIRLIRGNSSNGVTTGGAKKKKGKSLAHK